MPNQKSKPEPKLRIKKLPDLSRKKNIFIGLTGGIASGKSRVAAILKERGLPVVCADAIVHNFLQPHTKLFKKVIKIFDEKYLNVDGTLNRRELGKAVFKNKKLKHQLETVLHPQVRKEIWRQAKILAKKNHIVFLDIPLLFENHWGKDLDLTVCIFATQRHQIERLRHYRKLTIQECHDRLKNQLPIRKKAELADVVIENTGTPAKLNFLTQKFARLLRKNYGG